MLTGELPCPSKYRKRIDPLIPPKQINSKISDTESIEKFPCEDLRTIDQLWVKYSNGRFGFSVQKRIYQSLGGTTKYYEKVWERFGDGVGWRENREWLYKEDLTFSEKAPEAHLRVMEEDFLGGLGWW